MSADVRIVVRMANASVGRALRPVAQPGAVLDVAELASLSFVETAVNRTTHALDLGGTDFIVASLRERRATARSRRCGATSHRSPSGPPTDRPTVSSPGRDHADRPGDLVTLLGTASDFRDGRAASRGANGPRRSGATLRRRMREALGAMSDAVDRPFRIAFAVLALLAAISVVVLTNGYEEADGTRMDVLDAVYFTSETIATVGFGDFYFRDQSTWLRVWAILLILLGATLVALATALLTNALVSRRLAQSLGRQRVTGMADHIVVIGLGSVGSKVAMDLHEAGYEVAVIDGGDGQRFVPKMRAAGIPVLIGDATLPETQAAAGVHRAAGIAVLTSDDLVNIETGLAVRGVVGDRPVPIALRVFSRNLARVIGAGLDAGHRALDRRARLAVVRGCGPRPRRARHLLRRLDPLRRGAAPGARGRWPGRGLHPGSRCRHAHRRPAVGGRRGARAPAAPGGRAACGGQRVPHRPVRGPAVPAAEGVSRPPT